MNVNNIYFKIVIVLGVLFILFLGITLFFFFQSKFDNNKEKYQQISENEQYGTKYNQTREKLGIPTIPDDWYTFNTSILIRDNFTQKYEYSNNNWTSQIWSEFNDDIKYPAHIEKKINRYNNKISSETDTYKYVKSDSIYILQIKYNYLSPKNPWVCTFQKSEKIDNSNDLFIDEISIKAADSILSSWKLNRKNN